MQQEPSNEIVKQGIYVNKLWLFKRNFQVKSFGPLNTIEYHRFGFQFILTKEPLKSESIKRKPEIPHWLL